MRKALVFLPLLLVLLGTAATATELKLNAWYDPATNLKLSVGHHEKGAVGFNGIQVNTSLFPPGTYNCQYRIYVYKYSNGFTRQSMGVAGLTLTVQAGPGPGQTGGAYSWEQVNPPAGSGYALPVVEQGSTGAWEDRYELEFIGCVTAGFTDVQHSVDSVNITQNIIQAKSPHQSTPPATKVVQMTGYLGLSDEPDRTTWYDIRLQSLAKKDTQLRLQVDWQRGGPQQYVETSLVPGTETLMQQGHLPAGGIAVHEVFGGVVTPGGVGFTWIVTYGGVTLASGSVGPADEIIDNTIFINAGQQYGSAPGVDPGPDGRPEEAGYKPPEYDPDSPTAPEGTTNPGTGTGTPGTGTKPAISQAGPQGAQMDNANAPTEQMTKADFYDAVRAALNDASKDQQAAPKITGSPTDNSGAFDQRGKLDDVQGQLDNATGKLSEAGDASKALATDAGAKLTEKVPSSVGTRTSWSLGTFTIGERTVNLGLDTTDYPAIAKARAAILFALAIAWTFLVVATLKHYLV